MYCDDLIKLMHKAYRNDPWLQELFQSAGITLDNLTEYVNELNAQYFFDTATDAGLRIYEKELGIAPASTIENRRAAVEAAWKNGAKVGIEQLQAVADSWKNGEIDVSFQDGKIHIQFIGDFGVPSDLDSLKEAMERTKPAHLAIVYAFRYILIKDIHEVVTLKEVEEFTLNLFAGGA